MNKIKIQQLVLLLFIGQIAFAQLTNSVKIKSKTITDKGHYCATDQLNSNLANQNSIYKDRLNKMNDKWQKFAIEKANLLYNSRQSGNGNSTQAIYQSQTLPVIFHQMINGVSSPITSSITKPQLQAALTVLNNLYAGAATGSKAAGTNTDIQFCLAEVDALGSAIISYTYANPASLPLDNTNQGQITTLSNAVQSTLKFPPTRYINIYIVEDITSPTAGFAYMPPAHGSSFDGIYIEAQYLLPPSMPYDLAYNTTVLAHEMGHYLGLFHTFGICNPGPGMILPSQNCSCDNNNCLFDGDMVCDTPPDFSALPTTSCAAVNTCSTDASYTISAAPLLTSDVDDLINNYMDYGDWDCQHSFTQGQVNRMHFMIDELDGPRNSLLHSSACNTLCVNTTCTLSIISPNAVANSVILPNTLILSGASVTYTFTGTVCSGVYNTTNWSLIDLSTNLTIATGTNASFPTTFTALGNYRIVLNTSIAGSNPLCSQTKSLNIQVLPPASCPANLDMSNGWSQNWQRIEYENGWARTTNNGTAFTFPATTFTAHLTSYANGTTNSDPFRMTSTFSDPNFPSITTLPIGVTNIMRVGRLITPTTTLPPGDANYVTYTFTPTQANAKLRVWYLGMREKDPAAAVYGGDFATALAGSKTDFGIVCKYDFGSASSPATIVHRGTTHTGSSTYYFQNDITSVINPPTTSTVAIGTRTMEAMSNWQSRDLDFSEFICAQPTITVTFFARSDNASTLGFHHSYAYFGATCLPGLYKDIDLNLQNKDIACMSDVAESCTTINLPPPNNYTFFQNGNNYSDLLDVDLEESNDGITYTVIPTLPPGSNIFTVATPVLNLCKAPDNNPYKYYKITYSTLCQTITNTLTIFQGFVHNINDCAPNPMSGGSFINAPVTIGTQTVSPDKYVQYCGTTMLSLTLPCWWHAGDPAPVYQWQRFNGSWVNLAGETNASLVLNSNFNDICTKYRRTAKFYDIYCNNDTWIPSDEFSVTSLRSSNFGYIPLGPDVCVNDPATVNLNNFFEWGPFTCDIELNAASPVTNTVSFTFYSNSNCIPSNSITAITGPSVLTYTYTNNITTPLNISYTFNNTMYTANGNVYTVVEFNRYGCVSTFTLGDIPIKVKPSAAAGTITTSICWSPTDSITGTDPNATGYYWEYSYSSSFTPTLSLTTSTVSSVSIPATTFTAYPVYIRRVANGTNDCPNVAYSNTLTLSNNIPVITTSVSSTSVCSGSSATLTASGGTTYTWTAPTTTVNPVVVTPVSTTIYTVTGANAGGCRATKTVTINVTTTPTLNISTATTTMCIGTVKTLTASGATTYTWSALPAYTSTLNPVTINPTVTTIYTLTGQTNGCVSTKTISISVISGATFTVSSPSASICPGSCMTLTATGVNSYTWLPASTNGSTAIVCPTIASTYTVLGFKTGSQCPSLQTVSVGILSTPTIGISGSTTFCSGSVTTLTATGGTSYVWAPIGGWLNTLTTGIPGVYSVTATNSLGCTSIRTITLTATPLATINVSPTTASVCPGGSYTFTASGTGATTFSWMPGSLTGTTAVLSPSSTTIYTVSGSSRGYCLGKTTVILTVLSTPTVSITGPLLICAGSATTLTVNGTGTYSWSTGVTTNTAAVNVSGLVSATLTGVNGCTAVATTTVNYGSTTVINISPSGTICVGTCTTLTASGPSSYTWSPGGANTSTLLVCPGSTSTYTVRGVKGTDCVNTATVMVTVAPNPTVNITGNTVICYNTTTLTVTGGGTYSWSPGGATTATIAVSTPGIKTVTVTVNGCSAIKSVTVTQPGPPACMIQSKMSNNDTNDNLKSVKNSLHTIYPNPTTQTFSISDPDEINAVELFDYTGKLLRRINKEGKNSLEDIDISPYPSGIYMIRVINDNSEVELFKLIKE
jgi:hypothetical protein